MKPSDENIILQALSKAARGYLIQSSPLCHYPVHHVKPTAMEPVSHPQLTNVSSVIDEDRHIPYHLSPATLSPVHIKSSSIGLILTFARRRSNSTCLAVPRESSSTFNGTQQAEAVRLDYGQGPLRPLTISRKPSLS
jgi:hypothetical protein